MFAYILQHVTAVPISKAVTSGSSVSFMSFSMPNILNPMYIQQLTAVIFPPYPNIVRIRKQIILFNFNQLPSRLVAFLKLIYASVCVSNVLVLIHSSSINIPSRYRTPTEMSTSLKSYIAQILMFC